jgi:hypothetical protein
MKYFSQPSGHSSTRFILLASLAAILLTACGQKAADVSGGGTVATRDSGGKSSPASGAGQNPCSLLEPREVEAVLGGTLVGPPYRFDKTGKQGPAADGDACRYETAAYHFVEIEVEWTGGARMMKMYGTVQNLVDQKMKGMLKLGDGSELTGEWDEAKVLNCCTFLAMRGDQMVTVDVTGANATLEQAAKIADAALKRIEKPLSVDAATGIAAAIARDATRPKERNPCSLVSRVEVEAALEAPLTKDPVVDGSKCMYTYAGDRFSGPIGLAISWRNGYAQFRQHGAMAAGMGGAFGLGGGAAQNKKESIAPDPALTGPWESAQEVQDEFSAVKKDVLITAGSVMTARERELARKLVALAIGKL